MLEPQGNLQASTLWIGQWLFELKMGGEILVATSRPTVGAPCGIIFTVDQKLGRANHASIFVRPTPGFADDLLCLGEVGDRIGYFHFLPISIGFIERLRFNEDFADGKRASPTSTRTSEGQVAMRQGIETQSSDSGHFRGAHDNQIASLGAKAKSYY